MKIDVHTHITQPLELLTERLRRNGFDRAYVCSSAVARGELIDSLESAREVMGRVAGVQNQAGDCAVSRTNRALAAEIQKYPDLLRGFGKVDLFQPDIPAAVEEIAELGLSGVGEIVGIHGSAARLAPVLAAAEARSLPVFLHTDYPVDAGDLKEIAALAREYRGAQIILGHMGGDFWMDAIAIARDTPNIWLDTSEIVNQVALQVAVNTVPDRVMFSTDFPWDAPESMEARVAALQNDGGVKAAVLGGNALRLFSNGK